MHLGTRRLKIRFGEAVIQVSCVSGSVPAAVESTETDTDCVGMPRITRLVTLPTDAERLEPHSHVGGSD